MNKLLQLSSQARRVILFIGIFGLACLANEARSQTISGRITATETGKPCRVSVW